MREPVKGGLVAMAAVLATVAVIVWLAWPAGDDGAKPVRVSAADRAGLVRSAMAFETAARTWGTDPAAATDRLADGPTTPTLNRLKAVRPRATALTGVWAGTTPEGAGPDAPSPACRTNRNGPACRARPTMMDLWSHLAWIMGARPLGEPTVTVTGPETVDVSGRSRVIWWTDATGAREFRAADGRSWWDFTPAVGTVSWRDTLRIRNGRVVARQAVENPGWLACPLLEPWDDDPAASVARWEDMTRPSIPLRGSRPNLGLDRDAAAPPLSNPGEPTGDAWRRILDTVPERVEY